MRRSDREVKEFEDMVKIMEKCDVCRLAFFDEEYPYILPLNFGMLACDGQVVLYFHGALEGKKYELMARNNKVSFEMDCSHRLVLTEDSKSCTMEYESIIGNGILEFVEEADKFDALCQIMRHYRAEDFGFSKAAMQHTHAFKLTVKQMTGKMRMMPQGK